MKTDAPKADMIKQEWFVVDATDQVLGRLATKVATILRGKHKPYFSPHLDVGDYVVVLNAEKIRLTGNKELQKIYKRYSGYPSGQTEIPYKKNKKSRPPRSSPDNTACTFCFIPLMRQTTRPGKTGKVISELKLMVS